MKRYIAATALLLALTIQSKAQWTFQGGVGIASPTTGYKTISDGGLLLQADINKRLKKVPRLGVGLAIGWARMHNDNNTGDVFQNARLDVVPILATADYELFHFIVRPYLGVGLGVGMYNLSYDDSQTGGKTLTNTSFCVMPRAGIRLRLLSLFQPFFELNLPMIMDGAPQGAGDADKATGYWGVLFGVGFRI